MAMQSQGNIQKWGNSSAIRLPAKILAVAGITNNSAVDIQAADGRLVIQRRERSQEQLFDKLLAQEEGMEELLKMLRGRLADAIKTTDENTRNVLALIAHLAPTEAE